jgi:hypothetical protein
MPPINLLSFADSALVAPLPSMFIAPKIPALSYLCSVTPNQRATPEISPFLVFAISF